MVQDPGDGTAVRISVGGRQLHAHTAGAGTASAALDAGQQRPAGRGQHRGDPQEQEELPPVAGPQARYACRRAAPRARRSWRSQPELAEPRVIVGSAALRPVEEALVLGDAQVVDAGVPAPHQPVVVEFPVLVAVGAVPVPRVVMALVGEAHGDAVALDGPQLLDQAVVQLALPLAGQEGHDLVPAVDELRPVAPLGVDGVGARDLLGIAGIPRVLGHAHLLDGGLVREGREWGTGHDALLSVSAAFGSWERRASRSSRAARKQPSGASATPAPIWPLPSELCRIPVVTFGVMPCSTTRRTSTPSGVPRPSVIGRVIRLDRPRHTRPSSRVSAAAAAAPPTNWLTAGEPAAAAPPRPTSSSTALSPMSGAPSSGPRPGW